MIIIDNLKKIIDIYPLYAQEAGVSEDDQATFKKGMVALADSLQSTYGRPEDEFHYVLEAYRFMLENLRSLAAMEEGKIDAREGFNGLLKEHNADYLLSDVIKGMEGELQLLSAQHYLDANLAKQVDEAAAKNKPEEVPELELNTITLFAGGNKRPACGRLRQQLRDDKAVMDGLFDSMVRSNDRIRGFGKPSPEFEGMRQSFEAVQKLNAAIDAQLNLLQIGDASAYDRLTELRKQYRDSLNTLAVNAKKYEDYKTARVGNRGTDNEKLRIKLARDAKSFARNCMNELDAVAEKEAAISGMSQYMSLLIPVLDKEPEVKKPAEEKPVKEKPVEEPVDEDALIPDVPIEAPKVKKADDPVPEEKFDILRLNKKVPFAPEPEEKAGVKFPEVKGAHLDRARAALQDDENCQKMRDVTYKKWFTNGGAFPKVVGLKAEAPEEEYQQLLTRALAGALLAGSADKKLETALNEFINTEKITPELINGGMAAYNNIAAGIKGKNPEMKVKNMAMLRLAGKISHMDGMADAGKGYMEIVNILDQGGAEGLPPEMNNLTEGLVMTLATLKTGSNALNELNSRFEKLKDGEKIKLLGDVFEARLLQHQMEKFKAAHPDETDISAAVEQFTVENEGRVRGTLERGADLTEALKGDLNKLAEFVNVKSAPTDQSFAAMSEKIFGSVMPGVEKGARSAMQEKKAVKADEAKKPAPAKEKPAAPAKAK